MYRNIQKIDTNTDKYLCLAITTPNRKTKQRENKDKKRWNADNYSKKLKIKPQFHHERADAE